MRPPADLGAIADAVSYQGGHDREWYERRLAGFGASEAAALLGISRWRSAREVVEAKARRIIPADNEPERLRLRIGREMEPILARHALELAKERGLVDERASFRRSSVLYSMTGYPWVLANADGFIADALVELKTDAYGYEAWGDEDGDPARSVPPVYYPQLQHALAATGRGRALLLVLIGLGERRLYEVPRDEEFIAGLLEVEAPLWAAVLEARARLDADPDASIDDLLPEYGATAADAAAARRKYALDDGLIVPASPAQEALIAELRAAKVATAEAEARELAAETRVIAAIGPNAGLSSTLGTVTYKLAADSRTVDWQKVANELGRYAPAQLPLLVEEATKMTPGKRRIHTPRSWTKLADRSAE